ncbi:pentapeptide repeat-containing protein [Protofrankia symbiont of Coriaria ruscifolia]|uniref:pentapeptide repeat-containing protein n=1 Tax=Protofrankia symbiont of Coriaria ruscifolia TaxID=1306542 RepID=UPI00104160CD|nr:pentapeptide repeat-containing protein [Protofrankia symbiont of Coriaria ruscifolia]
MGNGGGAAGGGDAGFDFFISYTGADKGWAEWIAWQLEKRIRISGRPAQAFIQAWDLVPGSDWAARMHRTLPASTRVVPVLSETYLRDSRYGNAEWLAVWPDDPDGRGRGIVPVRISACQPDGLLRSRTYIDLVGKDENAAAEELIRGITASITGRGKPTTAPAFPGTGGRTGPDFPGASSRGFLGDFSGEPAPSRQADSPGTADERTVTVLHLSGTRLPAQPTDGRTPPELVTWLSDDLRRLAADTGAGAGELRPDLVVVTGDLTETGAKREFEQAYDVLAGLADALRLDHNRFAIIPGSHDVNEKLCEAYFLQQEVADEEPVAPYWPKWTFFDRLLRRFYGPDADIGFRVGEEWSRFAVSDLKVVVAGLNSTVAQTHLAHHGWLGAEQLDSAAATLLGFAREGWLRIGAVYHDPIAEATSQNSELRDAEDLDRVLGPHLNLLLHGQGGNEQGGKAHTLSSSLPTLPLDQGDGRLRYQVIRIDRTGFTRFTPGQGPAGRRRPLHTTHDLASAYTVFPPPARSGTDHDDGGNGEGHDDGDDGQWPYRPADAAEALLPSARGRDRPRDLLDDAAEVARLRHPTARVERVEAAGEMAAHLRVWRAEGQVVEQRVIGLIAGNADAGAVEEFVRTIRRRYLAANPTLFSDLVYCGNDQADPELVAQAERAGVQLLSMPEYQGVLDLRGYLDRQTRGLESDQIYPPALYVPQRGTRLDVADQPLSQDTPVDALADVTDWLTTDQSRFVLVLGDFGRGKTFLLHELARRLPAQLPHVTPMLIELRGLEKSHDLDTLVAAHLANTGQTRFDLDAFRYMLHAGRIILLFDGFDELALRVTYDRAAEHLSTLTAAVRDKTKIVLTSRTQYFLTDDQVFKALTQRVDLIPGRRIVRIEDFTDAQIMSFLLHRYTWDRAVRTTDPVRRRAQAERRATERMTLIRGIHDLLGLSRNPRMLSFIAALDDERLEQAQGGDGTIRPADLYRELVDAWLDHEEQRARQRGASPSLSKADRLDAATRLALTLWGTTERHIGVEELTATAAAVLAGMSNPAKLTDAELTQMIGSGTLLVRDAGGRFSFIHSSVMEYLVATEAARRLAAGSAEDLLGTREMSELMADFFADLTGGDRAGGWAQDVVDDPHAAAETKANAVLVARRLGVQLRTRAKLAGADLAGQDLSHRSDLREADLRQANLTDTRIAHTDLTRADLREANLTGARIAHTDLTGADLREANLTDATVEDASLTRADLSGARLTRAKVRNSRLDGALFRRTRLDHTRIDHANLYGADLTDADLSDARLTDVDLTAADVMGSRWHRTAVLGGQPENIGDRYELAEAVVAGRDRAQLIQLPTTSLMDTADATAVAFSPDGTLLATGTQDGPVNLWDVRTGRRQRILTDRTNLVSSVAFSPDGTIIAAAAGDHTVRLWDTTTGEPLSPLTGHTGPVRSVEFSPGRATIASGSNDGTVRLWDADTGRHLRALTGNHTSWMSSVAFSPDGVTIAAAAGDHTVRLWDTTTGEPLRTLKGHLSTVWSVRFSPDGSIIASGSNDGTVRLWEATTGQLRYALTSSRTGSVRSVAFSPDGATIAAAGRHTVELWDTTTGKSLRTLKGHLSTVWSVRFSPDGSIIASGSNDGTVRLWDADTGTLIATLLGPTKDAWVVFVPDSSYKLGGTAGDSFQWKIKNVRFEMGELDPYDPAIRRLPDDAPLPLPANWQPVTPRIAPPGPRPPQPPSNTPRHGPFHRR